MQDYAKLVSGVTRFGELYGRINAMFDALCSQFSGTRFPDNPTMGQPCYRTDMTPPRLYHFNGTTWVDSAESSAGVAAVTSEVSIARGSAETLNARMSVALNPDGTLKGDAPASDWWTAEPDEIERVADNVFRAAGDKRHIYTARRAVLITLKRGVILSTWVLSSVYDAVDDSTQVTVWDAVIASTPTVVEFGQPVGNAPVSRDVYSEILTTSGNWRAHLEGRWFFGIQGGGAGGGSCIKTSGAAIGVYASGGGASGEYVSVVRYHKAGDVLPVVIGAGGARGDTASNGDGYPGGKTTFDGVVAQGGKGGLGYVDFPENRYSAGYGGSPNGNGSRGGNAMITNMSQSTGIAAALYSGVGGDSPFGVGGGVSHIGNTGTSGSTEGSAGTGYGSGGSGGAGNNKTAYGGKGAPGCVRITFIGV